MQYVKSKSLKKERPLDNRMATKVAVSATTARREKALYLDIKKQVWAKRSPASKTTQ